MVIVLGIAEDRLRVALLLVSTVLLAACQTGEMFVSPPLYTKVIDASTGIPVANVAVTMWSTEQPEIRQTGNTDKNGIIDFPRLTGRVRTAFPLVADRILPGAIVRFEANGYAPKEINSDRDRHLFDGPRKLN